MQIGPLSLITKQAYSPHKVMHHHDSLIFSITSEKMNSRKQTLLLDESKQMKKSIQEPMLKDYFTIQDKIKLLEEKVQNIQTQYCQSSNKSQNYYDKDKQNKPDIINLQFPQQIYERKQIVTNDNQNQIGKIKRKKQKYYTGVQQKTRQKTKSNSKNQESILSTKRNNLTTYNINDFSVYRGKHSSFRHNQTTLENKSHSRQRSTSFSLKKNQNLFITENKKGQIKKLKNQLVRHKLSNEKLSRKSRESQRKLSICKDDMKKIKDENIALHKQITLLKQKLKKSQTIKQRQKQTIQQQKQQIFQLKGFLQQFLTRNNPVTLNQTFSHQKLGKITKLRLLR